MTTESLSTSSIQPSTTSSAPSFRWQSAYMAYAVIMFFVLIIGFFRQRVHHSCPSTTRAPYEEYHATYGEFSPRRPVHYRVWLPSDHRKQPKR